MLVDATAGLDADCSGNPDFSCGGGSRLGQCSPLNFCDLFIASYLPLATLTDSSTGSYVAVAVDADAIACVFVAGVAAPACGV